MLRPLPRLLLALVATLVLLPTITHAAPAAARSFKELGYGDSTAQSIDSSVDYFFPIPQGQAPQADTRLELVYSHSPLLLADRSTMTVSVNGQSLASVFLTKDNQAQARLAVPLPNAKSVAAFDATGYYVQVLFHMRLTRDACEESQNAALWATVHGNSALMMPLGPSAATLMLRAAPGLFAPGDAKTAPPTLVLPTNPQPEELDAAAGAAFQVGRWAAQAGTAPRLLVDTKPAADAPGIVVMAGGALPKDDTWGALRWDGKAFTSDAGAIAENDGVLAIRAGAAPQLLVSGATPAAVAQSARALAQQPLTAIRSSSLVVTGAPAASPNGAWQEGAASFAQLGTGQREAVGPGEHRLDFAFERPAGWLLGAGGALDLVVASAASLRSDTSWVAASVNGYDLGSQRLQPSADAAGLHYRFALPEGVLNATIDGQPVRQLVLQVRLFLDVPQRACEAITSDMARATLEPTSAWMLPHETFEGLDLGRFPSPLASTAQSPLVVGLPANATAAERAAGLQLIAALGRWSAYGGFSAPRLLPADKLDDALLSRSDLVLIGSAERNAAVAAALTRNAGLQAAGDLAAYAPDAAAARGRLRLARSPWADGHTLLWLAGSDEAGTALAVQALADPTSLAQLRGEAAVVGASVPPQTVVASTPAEPPPAALAPRVETPLAQRVPAWQIVGAVLLGAFIAVLGVIAIARWPRRKAAR